ncbi:MAG: hypothetical protein ACO1RX_08685 [Candidatus Sericytochromatia bacterium]
MSLSALVIAMLALLLLAMSTVLWLFWRQLQLLQQRMAPPAAPEPVIHAPAVESAPAFQRLQPSLGLVSQGDWSQHAVAWELAQAEVQKGTSVLLIDTDPAQGLSRHLQTSASATAQEILPGLLLCSLSADSGDLPAQIEARRSQAERVLVCLPPLTHPHSARSLASLEHILLVSRLDAEAAQSLGATAGHLQAQLSLRQTLWGVQISDFDPHNSDSVALYQHMQQQRPELLLAPPRPLGSWQRAQSVPSWAQTLATRLPQAEKTLVNV